MSSLVSCMGGADIVRLVSLSRITKHGMNNPQGLIDKS